MELRNVVKTVSGVELILHNVYGGVCLSPNIEIDGSTVLQIKMISARHKEAFDSVYISDTYFIFVRFTKLRPDDDLTYTASISSTKLGLNGKRFTSDEGDWHVLTSFTVIAKDIDLSVRMDVLPFVDSFASLHEDTELTDFELRGTDGAVRMHRAVLAAASPVLRRMLSGEWREAAEGHVDVPGTTSATLQHLKNYIYVHTLPDTGLEQLLLLSSYYMMPDLKHKCVDKLVDNLSANNAWKVLEFAAQHQVWRLTLGIVESVQNGRISATDIKSHVSIQY